MPTVSMGTPTVTEFDPTSWGAVSSGTAAAAGGTTSTACDGVGPWGSTGDAITLGLFTGPFAAGLAPAEAVPTGWTVLHVSVAITIQGTVRWDCAPCATTCSFSREGLSLALVDGSGAVLSDASGPLSMADTTANVAWISGVLEYAAGDTVPVIAAQVDAVDAVHTYYMDVSVIVNAFYAGATVPPTPDPPPPPPPVPPPVATDTPTVWTPPTPIASPCGAMAMRALREVAQQHGPTVTAWRR